MTRPTAEVLVVEDDPGVGKLIQLSLERAGYQIRLAPTIAAARELLQEARPDLVLLDIGLPDGDGLDLCAELHADGADGPATLVVSAQATESSRALMLGARDFIAKPFRASDLTAHVRAALRDHRALTLEHAARARAELECARLAEVALDALIGAAATLDRLAVRLPTIDRDVERALGQLHHSIEELRSAAP